MSVLFFLFCWDRVHQWNSTELESNWPWMLAPMWLPTRRMPRWRLCVQEVSGVTHREARAVGQQGRTELWWGHKTANPMRSSSIQMSCFKARRWGPHSSSPTSHWVSAGSGRWLPSAESNPCGGTPLGGKRQGLALPVGLGRGGNGSLGLGTYPSIYYRCSMNAHHYPC